MYAQGFEIGAASEHPRNLVCRELLPALRLEPGFSGALSLVHREMDRMLLLIFWETEEEAARPLPPSLASLLATLGVADPATYMPIVWEVAARA